MIDPTQGMPMSDCTREMDLTTKHYNYIVYTYSGWGGGGGYGSGGILGFSGSGGSSDVSRLK